MKYTSEAKMVLMLLSVIVTVTGCTLNLEYDGLGNIESIEFVTEECRG